MPFASRCPIPHFTKICRFIRPLFRLPFSCRICFCVKYCCVVIMTQENTKLCDFSNTNIASIRYQKEFLAPLPGRIFNTYQVPNHKSHLLAIYITCHLPLVFLSHTSQKFVVLFALFFIRRFLVRSVF